MQPDERAQPPRRVDAFLEAKLHWPRIRAGWVARQRLLDMFDAASARPVTLVAAPAGYGKTTLAAQWLESDRGPGAAAWVSLDTADNDPDRLWTHIAAALERAGCALVPDVGGFMASNSGDLIAGVLPKIIHALAGVDEPIVLIFDDFHYLQSAACREQVEFLIENLPETAHLVIMSRADPGLRLGRLRASGSLAEIRAEQLSFTRDETATLLEGESVELSPPTVDHLFGQTEGWPAGVYLASLSLAGRADADEYVQRSSGAERFIAAYFSEEVLSQGSARERDFIIEMSILERFCAPLCDAVGGTTDSAALLDDLERKNLFLVPLDGERRWFRFHHLFAAVARSELEASPPERQDELHRRAADWYTANAHVGEAITHLRAAGLRSEASRLVQANWLPFVDAGRAPTVLAWLQSLGRNRDAVDPGEEVVGAWLAALVGDQAGLAERVHALSALSDHGPLPDGCRSVDSALSLIGGLFGYDGPVLMRAAAQRAVDLETDGLSPFYAIANAGLGHAAYVMGELNAATELLGKAARSDAGPVLIRVGALGLQSLAEGELGRLDSSYALAEQAMSIVDERHMHGMPQASLAVTAFGQAQADQGKLGDALATLEQGLILRRRSQADPWAWIHHLMVMARVAVEASEVSMAQELLGDLAARLGRYPDGMASMRARYAQIQTALGERIAQGAREEPLTAREIEILLLLQASLSVREIAANLYLSTNTVKTHTQALYRKLGAHSRQEAVAIARRDQLI